MDISRFLNFKDKWTVVIRSLVFLTVIGYLLHWLGYLIFNNSITPPFIKGSLEPIIVVFFLVYLIALLFVVGVFLKEFKKRMFHLMNRVYIFRSQDWPSEWLFSGRPYSEASSKLVIQSTRAGCLLKNHYWKNFRMTFEMKFLANLDNTLGLVFRAEDLDNYFMLELSNKHSEIKPHVRYRGGWDVIYPTGSKIFSNTGYIGVILDVKNNTAYLYVNNRLEFTWVLPTHVDVMYRESGNNDKPQKTDPDEKYVQEIPFRLQFGMVGFRAHPGQGAIVKGLKIESL